MTVIKKLEPNEYYLTRGSQGESVENLTLLSYDKETNSYNPDDNGNIWGAFDSDWGWLIAPSPLQDIVLAELEKTPYAQSLIQKFFPNKKHWAYFKSVLRHKYFVFLAGMKLNANIWLLLIHDWSKFLPDEFYPYADNFFDKQTKVMEDISAYAMFEGAPELAPHGYFTHDRFNTAWLHHQRRNPHHWQYWYLLQDEGPDIMIPMPEAFAREMVADWAGAGRTYTGKWSVQEWYEKNKDKILIHPDTRMLVESLIAEFKM